MLGYRTVSSRYKSDHNSPDHLKQDKKLKTSCGGANQLLTRLKKPDYWYHTWRQCFVETGDAMPQYREVNLRRSRSSIALNATISFYGVRQSSSVDLRRLAQKSQRSRPWRNSNVW